MSQRGVTAQYCIAPRNCLSSKRTPYYAHYYLMWVYVLLVEYVDKTPVYSHYLFYYGSTHGVSTNDNLRLEYIQNFLIQKVRSLLSSRFYKNTPTITGCCSHENILSHNYYRIVNFHCQWAPNRGIIWHGVYVPHMDTILQCCPLRRSFNTHNSI